MSYSTVLTSVRRLRGLLAERHGLEQSDEQLLAAFTDRRDEIAFATLVRRHGPMVLGVCRRVLGHMQDAEDAYQATFLVLARRAAALRDKTALASFLHGTAYHLASKIQRAAGRRRKYEGSVGALMQPRSPANPADELLWREVRTLLDEEIARLPEKYRSVFVLCCLEELSREEAGRRLGLKERTVLSRLATARKRLQRRLARRGVELTAVLAAATLATRSAPALPVGLMASTMKAVLATAAGEGLAGVVSASVAELVQGATAAMMVSKTKIAAVVLAVALLGGTGLWWSVGFKVLSGGRQPPETGKAQGADAPRSAKREAAKTVEIQGRVLGPDGQPKAGAKLLLLGKDKKIVELGVTAADGRFSVLVPKEAKDRYLVARTNDTGIDIRWTGDLTREKPVEMRLVQDQPIRGRVVNTEGKPVAGVRVAANDVNIYPNNSLDRFLAFWKNLQVPQNPLFGGYQVRDAAGALFTTTTDTEGRFVLRGLGVERFISLRLSGAGIAEVNLWIVTRPNFDPKPYNQAVLDNTPKDVLDYFGKARLLHGPDVSVVAEAEKIVRGTVTEADTGKGRPNVPVQLLSMGSAQAEGLQTRTDAAGRYEIHGARKAKSYVLEVPSDPATGYMGRQLSADETPGYQPVNANITVKKGVIITGKMIDQTTGKPINGLVRAVPLNGNPFLKDHPGSDSAAWNSFAVTDADGVFRVVTIPGPVLLMGKPRMTTADFKYKPSRPDSKYARYFMARPSGSFLFSYPGGGWFFIDGIFFKVLEIKAEAKVVEQNITLERLPAMTIHIQDAEGKPLTHAIVAGQTAPGHYPIWFAESTCTAYGIEPSKPRLMLFYHLPRKLAATLTLKGDEKQPVAVKLGPAGAIKGRLLDADGEALTGVRVNLRYHHRDADAMHRCIHKEKQIETDAKGAFTLDDVLPGFKFELSFRRGRRRFELASKPAEAAIQVKPGECRDLGTLKLKLLPE